MKKISVILGAMLLFAATTASAEHKLLVTDIVDPGHVEAEAAWEFTHFNQDVKGNVSEAGFSIGVGLAKNLELDITLPYVLKEAVGEESAKGWGDLTVGAKYRILKESPITLTAAFDVEFDTGSKAVSGDEHHITYSPSLAISKNLGHETIPYAFYKAAFNSNGPDAHTLAIGLEKELNHTVTLDAKFDTTFFVGAEDLTVYNLDLGAYLQVCKNVYVIPSVGIGRLHADGAEATALKGGAALYMLF